LTGSHQVTQSLMLFSSRICSTI